MPSSAEHLRLRPLAIGLLLAVSGLSLASWGVWTGAVGGVVLGTGLFVSWLLDGVILLVGDPWRASQVTRQVVPHPVQTGQLVNVWLLNDSRLRSSAGWLTTSYQDHVPWEQGWVTVADTINPATGGHGHYGVTPPWRGVVEFGPLRLLANSPLGLWQSGRTNTPVTPLTVWPTTVPMVVPPAAAAETRVATGMGMPRPHLDDTTLREYQPGDDLHRVHWRSLARTNTLLTRAEEPSAVWRTVGVLWARPGADLDAVDLGVELLASWGEAMRRAGQSFDLRLGAETLRQPGRAQLMDALAAVDADDLTTVPAEDELVGTNWCVLVAVAGFEDTTLVVPALDGVAVAIAPPRVVIAGAAGLAAIRVDPGASLADAARALQVGLESRYQTGASQ